MKTHFLSSAAGAAMAAAMLLAPLSPGPAQAQETSAKPVIGACVGCMHKFTKDDIIKMLKDEGYGSVRAGKGNLVLFKAEGRTMGVNATKSGSLVYVYLTGSMPLSLEALNTWNMRSSFSKAIRTKKGGNLLRTVLIASSEGLPAKQVRVMTKMYSAFLTVKFEEFYRKEIAKQAK